MDAYCENGECRVVLYRAEPSVDYDVEGVSTNCPSCGRYGRLKDDPKKLEQEKTIEEY